MSMNSMQRFGLFIAASLLAAMAQAQIVSGVMTVTGAEMH